MAFPCSIFSENSPGVELWKWCCMIILGKDCSRNLSRIYLLVVFTLSMHENYNLFLWFYLYISTPLLMGTYRVLTSYPVWRIPHSQHNFLGSIQDLLPVSASTWSCTRWKPTSGGQPQHANKCCEVQGVPKNYEPTLFPISLLFINILRSNFNKNKFKPWLTSYNVQHSSTMSWTPTEKKLFWVLFCPEFLQFRETDV